MKAIPLINEIGAQQAIFLHHLRTNPNKVEQIDGELVTEDGKMCALGLGMEAFGMIAAYKKALKDAEKNPWDLTPPSYDPYKEIASRLKISVEHVDEVYELNDSYLLSFSDIADILEEYFLQGAPYYNGPVEIHMQRQSKKFAEIWDRSRAKLIELLASLTEELEEEFEGNVDTSFLVEDINEMPGKEAAANFI